MPEAAIPTPPFTGNRPPEKVPPPPQEPRPPKPRTGVTFTVSGIPETMANQLTKIIVLYAQRSGEKGITWETKR